MPQATANEIASGGDRSPFQYAAHYRPDYDYSPLHKRLDAALKHLYSKTNLATMVLDKGRCLKNLATFST
jgi:hypothetical protein